MRTSGADVCTPSRTFPCDSTESRSDHLSDPDHKSTDIPGALVFVFVVLLNGVRAALDAGCKGTAR